MYGQLNRILAEKKKAQEQETRQALHEILEDPEKRRAFLDLLKSEAEALIELERKKL